LLDSLTDFVGPTAAGKTGLAVRLAEELDGEVVSADSQQVPMRGTLEHDRYAVAPEK